MRGPGLAFSVRQASRRDFRLEIGDPEGAIRPVDLKLDRIIATMNHDELIPDKMGKPGR